MVRGDKWLPVTDKDIEDYFAWSENGTKKTDRYYEPKNPLVEKDFSGWNRLLWAKEWIGRMALIKKQFDDLQRKRFLETGHWIFAIKDDFREIEED